MVFIYKLKSIAEMDKQTKKKLRLVLIMFIIIMIPSSVLLKISYGTYLNDRAIHNHYHGGNIGMTEYESAQKSIKDLEKAKKFYKTNYIIYYNQAKIYAQIDQYEKAIETINDLIEIDAEKIKAHRFVGIYNELAGNKEKAIDHFLKYKNLRTIKYPVEKLNNIELKGLRIEEAMDFFFLDDTLSFRKKTDELKKLYPDDYFINGLEKQFKKGDRLELLRQIIL